MDRKAKTVTDAVQLSQTAALISDSVKSILVEWSKEAESINNPANPVIGTASADTLPSYELFDAQRTLIAATGKLTELVAEPSDRIIDVATLFQESRALYIAAERRIPDLLEKTDKNGGMSISDISKAVKIESRKLSRIMRYLCSVGIFRETGQDVFANNSISAALIHNEPLRAYVVLDNSEVFSASDRLPKILVDPEKGPSYEAGKTAWQDAVGTTKQRWEWMEERFEPEKLKDSYGHYPGHPSLAAELPSKGEDGLAARPELEIMGLAMVGSGRVHGTAAIYDFPWASLGHSLVVDVGGGVGSFPLQLSKAYPDLTFIVQDRPAVLRQGVEDVWPKGNPDALETGRVQFVAHNFFDKNPTVGADAYILRYILHDWSDDCCIKILSAIRESMEPHSRILICDHVMNTTRGNPVMKSAPSPLPANYGFHARYSHARDMTMMAALNGIERTPDQFEALFKAAGLRMKRIYDCRSPVGLIEAELA